MRKLFRQLHLWLSVPFGLILSVICFSGAALVFEDELMELSYPERYLVKQVGEAPLPVAELMAVVAQSLPDSITPTSINISSDPERTWQVGLSKPHRASVFINPYTGEVLHHNDRSGFFPFMLRLHRWLLDSARSPDGGISTGKLVVGVSTLMMVFALISGIVIWIPRTRKGLKNRLKISVRKGWKRFWYDLHVAGGVYTAVLLLVLALTGLTWSFSWYRNGFYKLFGAEVAQQPQQERPREGNREAKGDRENRKGRGGGEGRTYNNWQKVYDQLAIQNPDYKRISVSAGAATVSFAHFGNQRAADRYSFDSRTGEITKASLYRDMDKAGKLRGWIYSVHVGSWGGMITKVLTFLAALLGGTLPLTGYYLWIKRSWKKRKSF